MERGLLISDLISPHLRSRSEDQHPQRSKDNKQDAGREPSNGNLAVGFFPSDEGNAQPDFQQTEPNHARSLHNRPHRLEFAANAAHFFKLPCYIS